VFGGELGQAYLGTQGDVWDAQCDMALALAGAVLTQSALTFRRRRSRP
jgi:putative membrane protein